MAAETLLQKMDLKNYQVHTHTSSLPLDLWMGVCYECCSFAICWLPIFTLHDWLGRFSWVKRRCSCVLAKWLNLMPRELRCWTMLQRRYKDKSGPSWHEDISSPCARLLSRYRNTGEVWNLVWKFGNVIGWILVPHDVGLSCCRFVLSKFLCLTSVQGVLLGSGIQDCVKKLLRFVFRRMFGCGLLERSFSKSKMPLLRFKLVIAEWPLARSTGYVDRQKQPLLFRYWSTSQTIGVPMMWYCCECLH